MDGGKYGLDEAVVEFCRKGFVLGSIGRLSPEKGYGDLIKALKILIEHGVDAKLVIIGEGAERCRLAKIGEKLGVVDRLLMPGYREMSKDYIKLFHVYVSSSLTEGLPVTWHEAMQRRAAAVARDVKGMPRELGDGKIRLLVGPRSPQTIAMELWEIYKNRLVLSMPSYFLLINSAATMGLIDFLKGRKGASWVSVAY